MIFGLIAATGLRLSEALHLRCGDVDLEQGVLTVRNTKFRKSRYVPVHPTVAAALNRYLAVRLRPVDQAPQTDRRGFRLGKTVGGVAQTVYRGLELVRSRFILTMAANNLARLSRLLAA